MKTIPTRIVIYSKDIVNITGRRERTARKLLQKIRNALGKKPHEFITIREFCLFTGLNEDHVKDFLQD